MSFATMVPDRKAPTLLPIIDSVIRPGGIINSNEWPAYRVLSNNDQYIHNTIKHKYYLLTLYWRLNSERWKSQL